MERLTRRKKLSQEIKGALIGLYQNGNSYSNIAQTLDINVSYTNIFIFVYESLYE